MIFDENTYGLILLKPSYGLPKSDSFGIVEDLEHLSLPSMFQTID